MFTRTGIFCREDVSLLLKKRHRRLKNATRRVRNRIRDSGYGLKEKEELDENDLERILRMDRDAFDTSLGMVQPIFEVSEQE